MGRRRFGYRRLTLMLRREGIVVNHKRVHRIYGTLGLNFGPAENVACGTNGGMRSSRHPAE